MSMQKQADYVRQLLAIGELSATVKVAEADVKATSKASEALKAVAEKNLETAHKAVDEAQAQLVEISEGLAPEWTAGVDAMTSKQLATALSDLEKQIEDAKQHTETRYVVNKRADEAERVAKARSRDLDTTLNIVRDDVITHGNHRGVLVMAAILAVMIVSSLTLWFVQAGRAEDRVANSNFVNAMADQHDQTRRESEERDQEILETLEALPKATQDIVRDELAKLPAPQQVDLGPLTQEVAETRADVLNAQVQMTALGSKVDGLGVQVVDLGVKVSGNGDRIAQVGGDVTTLREEVGNIAGATRAVVQEELAKLPASQVDLSGIDRRLGAIEDGQRATTARIDGLVTVISNQSVTTQVEKSQDIEIVWVKQDLPSDYIVALCRDGQYRPFYFDSVYLSSDKPDSVKLVGRDFGSEGAIVPWTSVRAGLGGLKQRLVMIQASMEGGE